MNPRLARRCAFGENLRSRAAASRCAAAYARELPRLRRRLSPKQPSDAGLRAGRDGDGARPAGHRQVLRRDVLRRRRVGGRGVRYADGQERRHGEGRALLHVRAGARALRPPVGRAAVGRRQPAGALECGGGVGVGGGRGDQRDAGAGGEPARREADRAPFEAAPRAEPEGDRARVAGRRRGGGPRQGAEQQGVQGQEAGDGDAAAGGPQQAAERGGRRRVRDDRRDDGGAVKLPRADAERPADGVRGRRARRPREAPRGVGAGGPRRAAEAGAASAVAREAAAGARRRRRRRRRRQLQPRPRRRRRRHARPARRLAVDPALARPAERRECVRDQRRRRRPRAPRRRDLPPHLLVHARVPRAVWCSTAATTRAST